MGELRKSETAAMIKLGKTCSHGRTWDEPCRECQLVSARETVKHWGAAVDEARKVIAEAVGKSVMLKVDGKPFRCQCGCNVMHRVSGDRDLYQCNACELQYEGQ